MLLPTPTAESYGSSLNGSPRDGRREDYGEAAGKPSLETMARDGTITTAVERLPTPTASMGDKGGRGELTSTVTRGHNGRRRSLPTPRANRGGFPDSHGSTAAWVTYLPTPTASDANASGSRVGNPQTKAHPGVSLTDVMVRGKRLPTPTTNDAKNAILPPSQMNRDSLAGSILRGELLPTPTSASATQGPGHAQSAEGSQNLVTTGSLSDRGGSRYLHPLFVEWMQGFPPQWTDLAGDDDDDL